jgi:hypothetical protein
MPSLPAAPIARREFLAGAAALLASACGVMAQIRGTEHVLSAPPSEAWRAVLSALITSILPFEHARFPALDAAALEQTLLQLFPIGQEPGLVDVPVALVLFDDCGLFETPLAPFIADERQSLRASHVTSFELDASVQRAAASDRRAFHRYARQFGNARFIDQPVAAQRAYLALWAGSELIARRRVYRGWKSLVTISAYSTEPFWHAIGYDGPLLPQG